MSNMGAETIKTADCGYVGAGLGCGLGLAPAVSVSHSIDAAAVCGV